MQIQMCGGTGELSRGAKCQAQKMRMNGLGGRAFKFYPAVTSGVSHHCLLEALAVAEILLRCLVVSLLYFRMV